MKPFETTQSSRVEFVNNSYMIQAVIQNCSTNKVFVESVHFKNAATKDLQVVDLNKIQKSNDKSTDNIELETVFDESVCFHPDEQRSYLFMLKTVKPSFKIVNHKSHMLGQIIIIWKNYFGDSGQLALETVYSQASNQKLD